MNHTFNCNVKSIFHNKGNNHQFIVLCIIIVTTIHTKNNQHSLGMCVEGLVISLLGYIVRQIGHADWQSLESQNLTAQHL